VVAKPKKQKSPAPARGMLKRRSEGRLGGSQADLLRRHWLLSLPRTLFQIKLPADAVAFLILNNVYARVK